MKKPEVIEAMKEIQNNLIDKEARQKFWISVINDIDEDMKHRLRASELRGKPQADFIEKTQIEHVNTLTDFLLGGFYE